jgi:predicted O-methyltransferase YrrM
MPWTKTDRKILAKIFTDLHYTKGAEIGVERGDFSAFLCESIPNVKMLCVDPWTAYSRQSQAREDKIYGQAMQRLNGRNVEIMKMTSLEASQKIENGSLDFVYIDALHEFDPVMMDILLWAPKVRSGGIVSGHDYQVHYGFGVIQAVQAYTNVHNINPWYVTTEGFAPSWLWVNP